MLPQLYSRGSDPTLVQTQLHRCFDGIAKLKFEEQQQAAPQMSRRTRKLGSGHSMWSRLRGPAAVSSPDHRRESWLASLRRSGSSSDVPSDANSRTIVQGSPSAAYSNVKKLAVLAEEKKPSVAQAALQLMLSSSLKKSQPPAMLEVTTMLSATAEEVVLETYVVPQQHSFALEKWLSELETSMKATVRRQLLECVADGRTHDLLGWMQACFSIFCIVFKHCCGTVSFENWYAWYAVVSYRRCRVCLRAVVAVHVHLVCAATVMDSSS